jgi:hypothetical protein
MTARSLSAVAAPLAAGFFAAGWDALYLYVIWAVQEGDTGNGSEAGVWFIAASVAAAALFLALAPAVPWKTVRAAGLVASAVGLLGFAIIAALSIGVFLLPAVVLAFVASSAAVVSLPHDAASRARWSGLLVGLAFPAAFLVALAPA